MRKVLLTAAAAGLALCGQAIAQEAIAQEAIAQEAGPADTPPMHHRHIVAQPVGDTQWAHEPGTGESGPASAAASNITTNDTKSDIAPHLPMPAAGAAGDPATYLAEAQRALAAHQTGRAQQALEMAETRLLDRSTPASNTNYTSEDPAVAAVGRARAALGSGDVAGAQSAIAQAMQTGHP